MRISKIDRFLFFKLAKSYFGILLALAGAIWLVRILNVVDYYLSIGAGGQELLFFCLYLLPPILSNVATPCVLIALLAVYNQMLSSREYYVLTGAGLGPFTLFRPVIAFTLFIVACLFVLNFYVAPLMVQTLRIEREALAAQLSFGLIREGVFTDLGEGVTVFAQSKEAGGYVEGLLIYDERDAAQSALYIAQSGTFVTGINQSQLILKNGTIKTKRNGKPQVVQFETYPFPLNSGAQGTFDWSSLSPSQMTLPQLMNPEKLGISDPQKLSLIHARFLETIGELFSPIVLAFIVWAVVLGGPLQRSGYIRRIGLATILGILFFGGVVSMSSLVAKGSLPIISVFIYPLMIIGLATYVFIRRNRVFAVSNFAAIKSS
ncbi:LptF/LptG family permease [Alphaproteobacteria bacterium]|nr:LptF/LptG family permease [Alphaproteobacteria bacterium]